MNNNHLLKKLNVQIVFQILLFLFLLAVDQISKQLALHLLKDTEGITVIKGVLDLYFVKNTGAAFGILKNSLWIFYLISSLVFIILVILYLRIIRKLKIYIKEQSDPNIKTIRSTTVLEYIIAILAAGAIGNLTDRILYGYVIDFLSVRFIEFPVFNIADICVTLSVIALIVFFIFFYREDDGFRIFGKSNPNSTN